MPRRPTLTGLSWYGGSRPVREGGLVTEVGLNKGLKLAVDPEGIVPPEPRRRDLPSGPRLVVERLTPEPERTELEQRTEPSGRIRLPR